MNTIMQICIYVSIGLIIFNAATLYVGTLEDTEGNKLFPGMIGGTEFDEPLFTGILAGIGGLGVASILVRDIRPFAAGSFAAIFWLPLYNSVNIFLSVGVDIGLLGLFTLASAFVFLGALMGIIGGSG
jgi:hypothetical protein